MEEKNKIRIVKAEGKINKTRTYKVLRDQFNLSKDRALYCVKELEIHDKVEIIYDLSSRNINELLDILHDDFLSISLDSLPEYGPSYNHLNDHDFFHEIMDGEKIDNFFVDGELVFHKSTGSAIIIERNSVAQRILSILKSRNEKE